jgi:hypothetical protein
MTMSSSTCVPDGDDLSWKRVIAEDIMQRFASRTGLLDGGDPQERRYLWTDSFAVGNFLQLSRRRVGGENPVTTDTSSTTTTTTSTSGSTSFDYGQLALNLVGAVHEGLGRFRSDDDRNGRAHQYLSGGSSDHPTAGGLRIGKSMNEKELGDPDDSDIEWAKDGQYFHYLTKWMMALDQLTRYTNDPKYNQWALEMMATAADKFVYQDKMGRTHMYWKMSVDLSRPQAFSQGRSDPIDGYITIARLMSTCKDPIDSKVVEKQKAFLSMVHISTTEDPLG